LDDEDRKPAAEHFSYTRRRTLARVLQTKEQGTLGPWSLRVGRESKREPIIKTETAPANPSTDQAEASIPTETDQRSNLNRTFTVRKAAKRTDPLYIAPPQNIATSL
jgi:hypothetical protein